MPYTFHGHAYGDTTGHLQPARRARCGGPGICGPCSKEAASVQADTDRSTTVTTDQQDTAREQLAEALTTVVDNVRNSYPRAEGDAPTEELVTVIMTALAGRATIHQHKYAQRRAEDAIATYDARGAQTARLAETLGRAALGTSGRITQEVRLDERTTVVEITHGPTGDAPYAIVHDGQRVPCAYVTLDEALLAAVELRNGGSVDTGGYWFAANALGVPLSY